MKKIKSIAAMLVCLLCIFSLTACAASSESNNSSTEMLPKFSDETQSEIISSGPPSSEVSSSEKPSSESSSGKATESVPAQTKPVAKPQASSTTSSKPPASSQLSQAELDKIAYKEWEIEHEAREKEMEKSTKAYVKFVVKDDNGNAIQGVGTEFGNNYVPKSNGEVYVSLDTNAITNELGETSINLINYSLEHNVDKVKISWGRQFTATLTAPDGSVRTVKAEAESEHKYIAEFGAGHKKTVWVSL